MIMNVNCEKVCECSRCILTNNDDPYISFDNEAVCNHCKGFDKAWVSIPKTTAESEILLSPIIEKIKTAGEGEKYNCLVGVSGGVDSTYLSLLVKDLGLRPLAVHFDNGWNSELAVKNIEQIISTLDIDLITYVIDWEDFKALQLAYLKASVVDIEVLTDHAIYGSMYKIANEQGIKYIISGVNIATESVLPYSWIYDKLDSVNIKSIYKIFGSKKINSYPFVDAKAKAFIRKSGIEIIRLLDMIPFNVKQAKCEITDKLGWKNYEGKHFESIFTRFYQGYILPRKFGINKRKAHLSNLICSGQMTRDEALQEMQEEIYSQSQIEEDMEFVLKKLQLSRKEFQQIMNLPVRRHRDFDVAGSFFSQYPVFKPLRPIWKSWQNRNV